MQLDICQNHLLEICRHIHSHSYREPAAVLQTIAVYAKLGNPQLILCMIIWVYHIKNYCCLAWISKDLFTEGAKDVQQCAKILHHHSRNSKGCNAAALGSSIMLFYFLYFVCSDAL